MSKHTDTITRDNIEHQIAQLKQQREQLVANLNAVAGAIAVLEQLLNPTAPAATPAKG